MPSDVADTCAHWCTCSAELLNTESTAPIDCSKSPASLIASLPNEKSFAPANRPPPARSAFLKVEAKIFEDDFADFSASSSAEAKDSRNPFRAIVGSEANPLRKVPAILPNTLPLLAAESPSSSFAFFASSKDFLALLSASACEAICVVAVRETFTYFSRAEVTRASAL